MTSCSRRDWLTTCGPALLSLPALAASAEMSAPPASAPPKPTPAIGEQVQWPAVTLLDGRMLPPLAPGAEASVVVFFSTTCPFCVRHNAHVQKLLALAQGQPLRVLGVAHDRQAEHVRTYLKRQALSFDVSLDQGPLHAALSRKPGTPITCVVDRQQRLREVIRGEMFEEDVLGLLRWARA